MDFSKLSITELLSLHSEVAEELRNRGITRSFNNPTGDLAEFLFCKAFGWSRARNSHRGIDAIGEDGSRYQIKGRRLTANKSRQMGAIRELENKHFDFLAAVLFSEKYKVLRAAVIPCSIVEQKSKFVRHTNSHKFILRDDIWDAPGVRDVTAELQSLSL